VIQFMKEYSNQPNFKNDLTFGTNFSFYVKILEQLLQTLDYFLQVPLL